jgi:hypothetical protein
MGRERLFDQRGCKQAIALYAVLENVEHWRWRVLGPCQPAAGPHRNTADPPEETSRPDWLPQHREQHTTHLKNHAYGT